MFRKMIEENNEFVKRFTKFVCLEEKDSVNEYYICGRTGLQYLGEFFERYERESINPMDIVRGIACVSGDLKEHQMYDGQLDYFKGRIDSIMDSNEVFLDKLCYVIFLQKLGFEEESKLKLGNILESLKFDLDFLILTLAINYENLKMEDSFKDKIYEVLNNCNLDLDCLSLIKECTKGEAYLKKASALIALKVLEGTYEVKSKNIKDSKRLKFLKNLKKIGTRKLEYEDVEDFVTINKQDFYFICLKVSYEINENLVLYRTNEYLVELIEKSLDFNTKSYPYLYQIEVSRDKSSYWKRKIRLYNLDFNSIEPEYYSEFVKMYFLLSESIEYNFYEKLVSKESFLEFFKELDYDKYKEFKNTVALSVIASSEDKSLNDFYFSNIEGLSEDDNFEDISITDRFILIEKGYLDFLNCIESALIKTNDSTQKEMDFVLNEDYITLKYKGTYKNQLDKYNLKHTAFAFLNYIMKNNVKIVSISSINWIRNFVRDIYSVSLKNIFDLVKDEEDIKSNLNLILDYVFMYKTDDYVKCIVSLYKDDILNKYLNISEDEIKIICDECLNSKICDTQLMKDVKSILFDSKDNYLYECKAKFDRILEIDWSNPYSGCEHSILDLFYSFDKGNDEYKSEIRNYIKEAFFKTKTESVKNTSVKMLRGLINKDIIRKEDALEIISVYLD